ncbi:unnamed protein product [Caenorhabditis sp. 36 PRJEB53466]|nr:unnamed protein product [Caenorhabditis sp. 36 PRJEB53466]
MRHIVCVITLFGIALTAASSLVPELSTWAEDRYIQCVHCMDYDRSHISLFGCKPRRPILCNGNACFMRFHKDHARPSVMYTSGCLNLTNSEMRAISVAQKNSEESGNPYGTLLCELAERTDTCICSNMDKCNFINLSPDFSEYNQTPLLQNVGINEENHMKMFLPHEYRRIFYPASSPEDSSDKLRIFWIICIFFSFIHRLVHLQY